MIAGEELQALAKEVIVQPPEIIGQIRKFNGRVAIEAGFKQISSSENIFLDVAEHLTVREKRFTSNLGEWS